MKTIRKVSVILFLSVVLTSLNGSAQENVLKIDAFNSAIGNYSLSYERVVNKKQTINLNISFMPERNLFNILTEAFNSYSDMYSEIKLANRMSGFSISPEYRFYLGKNKTNSHKGFYIAPYVRASDYKILIHDKYYEQKTEIDADLFTTGLGVQLGAHWIFSDVFSLDFQFFGTGVDMHQITLDYSSKEKDFDFEGYGASIEKDNAEIPYIGSKLKNTIGDDYVKAKGTTFFPATRGRLTLGVAF